MRAIETSDRAMPGSARWQRGADLLARYAWRLLLVAIVAALIGAVAYAVWQPAADSAEPYFDECENPPCFGGGGMPQARDLPVIVPTLGYGLVILLGLPSALASGWDLLRGRWSASGRRALVFVGPLLFFIGMEIIPHLASPCLVADVLGNGELPSVCESSASGGDIKDRWHALDHTLVGALPMAALYWLALRGWRPDVVRFGSGAASAEPGR